MLTVSRLSHAYGPKVLLDEVSLQLNRGDRVGLVGPNGAGKSTLFSLILGSQEPDSGEVTFERGMQVGYLPQESMPVGDETVLDVALGHGRASHEHARSPVGSAAGGDFVAPDAFQREAKAKRLLSGLGFKNPDSDRPATELSGGWVMRAHLARLLVQEPDLLMLDEPTNHLDLEALLWLQGYLQGYPGAILIISHDREFLDRLVTRIWELDGGRVQHYRGNYTDYTVERVARLEQAQAAYDNQQREIERLMRFVERFRAKNTKATQAQSKLKQIERMEKLEAPTENRARVSMAFPQPERSGQRSIRLTDVHKAYGDNVVYQGIDLEIERGQRIVLVGPNGAGKSTLLKILAGVLPFERGTREPGHQVNVGYFSQYRVDMLQPNRSVLDEALDTPRTVTVEFVRTLLGCFLFRGDDVFKGVKVLSGGEKTRLALVKILLNPPNLLLMDEPTTHLDISSIDAVIDALEQYQGTLVFISHDVHFIRRIANHVIHVEAGELRHYPGGYDYYLGKRQADSERADVSLRSNGAMASPKEAGEGSKTSRKEQKRREAEQRQTRYRARKQHQDAVDRLEKAIAQAEGRIAELTEILEQPETYENPAKAVATNRELTELQERLEELNQEWEKAASELEAVDAR